MNWISYAEGLATGLTVAAGCFTAGVIYLRRKVRSIFMDGVTQLIITPAGDSDTR